MYGQELNRADRSEHGLHIAFTGTDGCGKSTQTTLLVARLAAAGQPALRAEAKDDFTNRVVQRLLGDDNPYAARNFLGQRTTDVVRCFDMLRDITGIVLPRTRIGMHVVVPRSVYCRLALARAFGETDVPALDRLERLLLSQPPPDLTIWLDVPVEITMARLRVRGGGDEDPAVMRRFATALHDLHDRHRFVHVDAAGTVAEVADQVWAEVEPRLPAHILRGRP